MNCVKPMNTATQTPSPTPWTPPHAITRKQQQTKPNSPTFSQLMKKLILNRTKSNFQKDHRLFIAFRLLHLLDRNRLARLTHPTLKLSARVLKDHRRMRVLWVSNPVITRWSFNQLSTQLINNGPNLKQRKAALVQDPT